MAKRKVKSKSKTKPRKRTNTMAAPKKRRRKKRSTTTAVRRRLSAAPKARKRRRSKGLSSGMTKSGLVKSGKSALAGSAGGALFLGTRLVKLPLWARTSLGYAAAIALGMFNAPSVGAGMAGATTYHLGQALLPTTMLNDGEMEDTDWVDADTLQDTGQVDENGNSIVMDEDGVAYALNDDNELEAIGEGSDMQSVSMLPMSDNPYSLANPYALSDGYN
jgi:hypothetical protein